MVRRRGDNIPTVADYAHWNEDAQRVWYEENRYDMEHADEILEDDDNVRDYEPDPFEDSFATYEEAKAFWDALPDTPTYAPSEWGGKWYVEHYDKEAHRRHNA